MPAWTPSQTIAIENTGGDLLVSASAGTGKTAVLVERIIRLALDEARPTDLDRFLVVTFTEAAAAEMREKIAAALQARLSEQPSDEHVRRQMLLLGGAQISTIHAFCNRVLRQHFHQIGLDPDFSILSEEESRLLQSEVAEAVFEKEFERSSPVQEGAPPGAGEGENSRGLPEAPVAVFLDWLDSFGGADPANEARRHLLRLHSFVMSLDDPAGWTATVRGAYPLDESGRGAVASPETQVWFAAWRKDLQGALEELGRGLDEAHARAAAIEPKYVEWMAPFREAVRRWLDACGTGDWEKAIREIQEFKFEKKMPPIRDKSAACERLQEDLRSLRKNALQDELQGNLAAWTPVQAARAHAGAAPFVHMILGLAERFEREYMAAKRSRAVLDFSDLEQLCLKVLRDPADPLKPSETAELCRAQFDYVLVDEYQDVNHVQDALLKLVSREGGPGRPRNLFAVGDVKQCIYAFRLAAPDVFLERYHSSAPLADAAESGGERPKASEEGRRERVSLSHNFRSREEILRAVNHLFARLMTPGSVGLAYDRGAALVAGAEFPSEGNARLHTPLAELHVVEAKPLEEEEDAGAEKDTANEGREGGEESGAGESPADWAGGEREAFLIGKRILEMTGGAGCDPSLAMRVFDRSPAGAGEDSGEGKGAGEDSAGGMRPAAFRDIVVLLRAVRGWAERFTRVFQRLGIPVFTDQGQGLLGTVEVRDVLNLLRVIDNPLQDIPLAAVLRSPFENWTDTDLTRIRLKKREGCFHEALRAAVEGFRGAKGGAAAADGDDAVAEKAARFLERLEGWRTRARREPLGDLVAAIYDETGYPAWALGQSGGENRQANLLRFHRIARQFDQFSRQGLSRFLRFVEQLEEEEGDYGAAAPVAEGQNVVRILSIHKSKGLEFPIVFLAGLGKKFNLRDTHAALLFTRRGGMGARVVDAERLVRYPTPVYRMLQREKKRESLAEEIRILYVAATRARERLILTGSARKVEDYVEKRRGRGEALQGGPLPAAEVLSAQTPLDWVIPALADCWGPASTAHAAPFRCFAHDLDEIRGWSLESGGTEEQSGVLSLESGGTEKQSGVWSPESGAKEKSTDYGLQTTDSHEMVEKILARIRWEYPHEALTRCPARIAASELKRRWGAGEEEGERARSLLEPPSVRTFSQPSALSTQHSPLSSQSSVLSTQSSLLNPQPSALSTHSSVLSSQHSALSTQHSPVERGAWTHLVLQQLDLLKPLDYAGISAQVDGMIGRGLLTEEQRSALDFGAIERFFASELGRRMLAIPPSKVWREAPFLIGLAPSEARMEDLGGYDEGERIRAQGIIDCLFEEEGGRLILVDYKTDAISTAELEARVELYRPQMGIYARAVEAVFGKPPDEAWLYFLALGRAEKT